VRIRRPIRRFPMTTLLILVHVLMLSYAVTAQSPDEGFPDLSGRWGTMQKLVATADLPFIGEIVLLTTVGLLSEITQSGSQLTLQDGYCFTDVEMSTDLFLTDIPDATVQSIHPPTRFAELRVEGEEILLVQDWHTEVRGAVLDDPVNDDLPSYRSDPRVIDMDEDGQIGMTIPAEIVGMFGGDTYAVQRFRYRLEGRLVDPETILGTVEWTTEQVILWATDALLMMPYTQSIDQDPTVHRFVMRRMDERSSCEALREQGESLLKLLDTADLSSDP